MNDESQDGLDRLLGKWAASHAADDQHTARLSSQILTAARDETNVGRNKSAQLLHKRHVVELPERRKALVRPTTSSADWGAQLMIGGGGFLMFLLLVGGLWYYNLTTVPPGGVRPTRPIAASSEATPLRAADTSELPLAASLGATVLAAKRHLLAETNALFENQLAWIAESPRDMSFAVRDQAAAADSGEFMIVRVVVAQRVSPASPWSTVWQTDVISRSEALVEIAPQQLDRSSLVLWTYVMPDGTVAVDMDLTLDPKSTLQASTSTVLQFGQPARVSCSTENGVEQCVFQTVMPLHPAPI